MRKADATTPRGVSLQHLLKCELAGETLRQFGTLQVQAMGLSMIPAVWPGDVLVVERCGRKSIRVGDVALCLREGRFFAHRVVECMERPGESLIFTQGDALPEKDPPLAALDVLGRVTRILRRDKIRTPAIGAGWANRLAAALAKRSAGATRFFTHCYLTWGNTRAWKALWET